MKNFTEAQILFEDYLAKETFKPSPDNLYDPCRHIMAIGGKRIRPVCVLMANELYAPITEDALHAASAIELFHNFTLIHDDIMDNAPLRRGKQTVHEKWNMPTAILSGDVMNVYAYQHLAKVHPKYLQAMFHIHLQDLFSDSIYSIMLIILESCKIYHLFRIFLQIFFVLKYHNCFHQFLNQWTYFYLLQIRGDELP